MEEQLKLTLSTEFLGTEDAAKYAEALRGVAAAESKLGRASRAAAKAVTEASKAKEAAAKALPQAPAVPDAAKPATTKPGSDPNYRSVGMGPFSRLKATEAALQKAVASNASEEKIKDLEYQLRAAQRLVDRASKPEGGGNAPRANAPQGPFQRLAKAQESLANARSAGASAEQLRDLEYREKLAQRQAKKASALVEGGAVLSNRFKDDYTRAGEAILSSRFSAGPFQPLFGRALRSALSPERASAAANFVKGFPGGDKIAPAIEGLAGANAAGIVGRLVAGPAGMAAAALYTIGKVGKAVYDAEFERAEKSAQATRRFVEDTAAFGNVEKSAVGRFVAGEDAANKAFAFQQRIATDPYARAAAARHGVSDLASPFGSLDPGKKMLDAIKSMAKENNEYIRRRESRSAGVEQEVERYRLLSEETKKSIASQAKLTGAINDLAQMRRGAEFEAAKERLEGAKGLLGTAGGKTFSRLATQGMNDLADAFETGAQVADSLDKARLSKHGPSLLDIGIVSAASAIDPSLGAWVGNSLLKQRAKENATESASVKDPQAQATEQLTNAILRLNKNIGETNRSREAVPQNLTGSGLYDALTMGALRMSALG